MVPPAGHLRPLDGLRALSILWVMAFHAAWYSFARIPDSAYAHLLLAWWMLPFWRGDFGVDVFFVLSGFLIGGMLADERRQTGRVRMGLFYVRRLMRLWPALAVGVFLDAVLVGDHVEMTWANLFYVSNFLSIAHAAMAWTWSLSIEEQFYIACPWLVVALGRVRSSTAAAVVTGVALAGCALGAWIVVRGPFFPFDAEIAVNRDLRLWVRSFDALYTKPWMRAGPLLAGVASAYLYRTERVMAAIARGGAATSAGLVAALVIAGAATHWQLVETAPRAWQVLYLATFRTAFGAGVAYLLLVSLSAHRVGRALGAALGSRVLYPISQLAYSAYLLNPLVAQMLHPSLGRMARGEPVAAMALFLSCDLVVTFGAATVLHLLVERPFMALRPRALRDGGSSPGS